MLEPLISIIIPVLNGVSFLERCFLTLDMQTYPNLEVIFIDNGSNDSSREIISNHCKQYENYFLLDCSIPGPGAARNHGIKSAKGEYISFLDVDDELSPNKHHVLIQEFIKYPHAAMAVGQTRKIFSDGREVMMNLGSLNVGLNISPTPGLLWMQQFQHHPHISSSMIRRESILDVNGFPENIFYGEDIALSVKIGIENHILYLDKFVSIYYRHPQSAVSKANQQISSLERYFQFYEKFALPLFYKKKGKEPFKQAFNVSERIAFRMLMKLIHVKKKKIYKNVYQRLVIKSYLKNRSFFYTFFHFCPFRISNYIFEKFSFK